MEYSSFAKYSPCYIYPQHWLASHRIVTNALHLFPQTQKEFYLLCQIEQNIKGHITMICTIEGWSSASKLSFLKMWFYIFHSFIYFYIFYIHAEIYILIQTESMEVFRNPFLERRFALRYTFIWDLLYSIHSFEICSTVYFHVKSCPSHHQSRFYLQRCIAWKVEKENVRKYWGRIFHPRTKDVTPSFPNILSPPWGSAYRVFINQCPSNSNIPCLVDHLSQDKLSTK